MKILLALLCAALALPAADAPKRPRITRVAHIALFVHDMAKAREFYTGLLGYQEPYLLNNNDGSLSLTFVKVNENQYLELFPEKEPGTDRLNHISFETDDIEALRVYLAAKGVPVPDKVGVARIKNKAFTVKDPDGHTVEFVEYTADGWTRRETGKFLPADRASDRMMHLGILVGSLEASRKFYGDILGFEEIWRGSSNGKVLSWTNMKVPDGDTYIEFMLYDKLPEANKRGTQHHICFEVADMDKAKAALEARPAAKTYGKPFEIRTGTNRKRQMNLYDPDGTRTELMEPKTVDNGVPAPKSDAPPPHN